MIHWVATIVLTLSLPVRARGVWDHRRVSERRHEPAEPGTDRPAPEVVAPRAAPAHVGRMLALQRSAGNQAAVRYLARDPTAEEARVSKLNADYDAAIAAKDWDTAAKLLNGYNDADIETRLTALTADSLRLMDDGAQRSMPGFDARVRDKIKAKLKDKFGLSDARAKTGGQYGEIRISVGTVKNGVKGSARGDYPVDIYFKPDTAVVKADEIAFIQRVRLVDTATGANKDWDATNIGRQTDRKSSIDRIAGKKQGWYGMDDDGANGSNLKKWTKAGAASVAEAWMYDNPGAQLESTTWEFETAAVSRSGPDAGTVYAVVTWGFSYDADLKITALPNKIFNKQSTDFTGAVDKWNAQAKGPAASSNVPAGGQVELPGLK
jgi:hypothetical protein